MSKLKRALRTFDAASLTANYQNIGAVIPFPVLKIAIINTSDVDVLIGDMSSEEDIRIPANSTMNIGEGFGNYGSYSSLKVVFTNNAQLQIKQVTAAGTGTIIMNLFG